MRKETADGLEDGSIDVVTVMVIVSVSVTGQLYMSGQQLFDKKFVRERPVIPPDLRPARTVFVYQVLQTANAAEVEVV